MFVLQAVGSRIQPSDNLTCLKVDWWRTKEFASEPRGPVMNHGRRGDDYNCNAGSPSTRPGTVIEPRGGIHGRWKPGVAAGLRIAAYFLMLGIIS